jgi:simple sugar transport system permease protein
MNKLPTWADVILIPLISLLLAAGISALVLLGIGKDPVEAVKMMISGALGSTYAWGFTLYYATNFMFTGLAVAVAFHARLFNIGGEGQAMLGGLGVAFIALYIPWPHWSLALLGGIIASGIFGAAWAYLPGVLQAKRGSHIVITTIMFNFIAAALLNYLLVEVLRPPSAMDPATDRFPAATHLPTLHELLAPFGIPFSKAAPANISLIIALLAAFFVWVLIWRTRLGYEIRAFGHSESAAKYAGINPVKITVVAMMISGALAGMMAINSTMGEAERLILNAPEGAGFIGIAVALMGRSHPVGIILASILFGVLYQGGAEISLWLQIPREMIVVLQALVIMFTGALDNMVRMPLAALFNTFKRREA